MRPVQCVFAGDPGTHNVCVCPIHQNVKLKLSAIDRRINYKDVIEAGVCSVDNKICMIHHKDALCDKCPNQNGMLRYIHHALLTWNTTIEGISDVKYTNWTIKNTEENSSISKVTLENFSEPINQFIDNLVKDIWNMTPHEFISHNHKEYFNHCKTNLDNDTGLLIMDFAENYTFLCQNSTQGFYFSNTSATLFTAGLYYKKEMGDELKVSTFCVISNTSKHQAYSVNICMEKILNQIKNEFLWIKNLIYFSDGAPTQFKNK